jgi:2-oxoglutarate dehydrogenase E2 component (dihydrolipoamide succinyltransferase)
MPIELKVPEVGESITDVQIGEWLKGVGDAVERDETIVMIETDKVTVELPAPSAGVISQIIVEQGVDATVGQVIGLLEEGAAMPARAPASPSASPAPGPAQPEPAAAEGDGPEQLDAAPASATGYARVMPSARRALRERGLTVDDVTPTGPGGRVLKEDVLRHEMQPQGGSPRVAAPPPDAVVRQGPARSPAGSARAVRMGERQEDVVPMTPLRRRIAERLVAAQQAAALLTTFNEVDMSAVMALRKEHRDTFLNKHGIKLGFMSFFVKAVVEALKVVPSVNAEIRDDAIVYKNYFDIGVAIGGGRGLVVPVIRSCERLGFAEIELAIADFAARAKNNQIKLDELQGGTFTISNGGIYGSMLSTPIINPPQSGILGMHAIEERAVVRDGQVVVRPMMYVALTYDHRLVDGREAVTFLKHVRSCIEQPARILLEV